MKKVIVSAVIFAIAITYGAWRLNGKSLGDKSGGQWFLDFGRLLGDSQQEGPESNQVQRPPSFSVAPSSQPSANGTSIPESHENPTPGSAPRQANVGPFISGQVLNPENHQEERIEGFLHCFVDGLGQKYRLRASGKFRIPHPVDESRFDLLFTPTRRDGKVDLFAVPQVVSITGDLTFRWGLKAEKSPEERRRNLEGARAVIPPDRADLLKELNDWEHQLNLDSEHGAVKLLVPAYFAPDSPHWTVLYDFIDKVKETTEVYVIINVSNGSGVYDPVLQQSLSRNDAYGQLVRDLSNRGIPWLGYMTLLRASDNDYIRHSWSDELEGWSSQYPGMSGLFLTEISHTLPVDNENAQSLRKFLADSRQSLAKGGASPILVANAGRYCDSTYADRPPIDWMSVSEAPHTDNCFHRPAWADQAPRTQFGSLAYDASTTSEVIDAFWAFATSGVEFCFVSQNRKTEVPWTVFLDRQTADALAEVVNEWNSTAVP